MKLLFLLLFSSYAFAGSPQGFAVMSDVVITTTASTQVLPNNPNRGYIILQNKGSSTCQVKFGEVVNNLGQDGLFVQSMQNYEAEEAFVKQPLYMRCGVTPTTIAIMQTNW